VELEDLDLGAEDRAIRDTIREVVAEKIAPRAREVDEQSVFPREAIDLLGKLGMLGILVPERYGGVGGTKLQYTMAVEEIARGCGATSATFMTQAHGALPILLAGSEEQKKRWLPGVASGEQIGAIALSEPQAGSDLAGLGTTARKEDGHYVLNGQKIFTTNGGHADVICALAKTDASAGAKGISAFLVEGDTPGLTAGEPLQKMGIRGSNTVEMFFDDVRVPAENRLGPEGAGFGIALGTLDGARLSTAAQALGLGQGAYDIAMSYAQERQQFGKPIYSFQAVQFRLVDMYIQLQAARALTYQVARMIDSHPEARHSKQTAAAKVLASDTAMRVTTDAVQVLGGYGYMREYEVERFMRDAKITQIYDGTNDINRLVVGRELIASSGGAARGGST
jgi:alkylation response protein AidB-like acyl-CoA dehydrogenase